MRVGALFAAATAVRLLLLVFGAWQDEHLEVKYTDIDYGVFTDGAELVVQGRSPFDRPTYRYTPLLALVLTPNVWLHAAFGKVLFATADLIIGLQIRAILLLRRVPGQLADRCTALWLLNPLAINVSTRGNAESLVTVLLLASVVALLQRRVALSGAILSGAIHLKLYPIIYAPAFLVALNAGSEPARFTPPARGGSWSPVFGEAPDGEERDGCPMAVGPIAGRVWRWTAPGS